MKALLIKERSTVIASVRNLRYFVAFVKKFVFYRRLNQRFRRWSRPRFTLRTYEFYLRRFIVTTRLAKWAFVRIYRSYCRGFIGRQAAHALRRTQAHRMFRDSSRLMRFRRREAQTIRALRSIKAIRLYKGVRRMRAHNAFLVGLTEEVSMAKNTPKRKYATIRYDHKHLNTR